MQKKILLFFILLLIPILFIGQTNTLINQLDEEGRKTGYWAQKLDENFNPTENQNYRYIIYQFYDSGQLLEIVYSGMKFRKKYTKLISFDNTTTPDTVINGNLLTYDKNDSIIQQHKIENGYSIYLESRVFTNKGSLKHIGKVYYDTLWNNEIGTAYIEEWERDSLKSRRWLRNGKYGWNANYPVDTVKNYPPAKYPYFGGELNRTIAVNIGYNLFSPNELEMGLLLNVMEGDNLKTNIYFGPSLTYRYSLAQQLNSIDLDIGLYGPLSLGFGLNSNFKNNEHILGFRPFIGTSLYNMQLIYGYNMFRDKKNDILNLNHHSLRVRIAIPIKRLEKSSSDL